MIRFIDLTGPYWTHPDESAPVCAFLSTSDELFISDAMGRMTFTSMADIESAEFLDTKRLGSLVPDGFFERVNHLTADEAEVVIDLYERLGVKGSQHSHLPLVQRAEKWVRQACNVLRERYT